ncbi:hypothetical protein N7447_006800 [Penicillium robsamsonii]|uniref:uncharacterized protein n=1 Tax=Penicillium robsamsonii TaxID=1792511 RepID=UPI0025466472|nr:uncharacterized protein N7447_006800 [Penicillium robsamsonii]KAJ5824460.1 hypothetical protein N7447_006800 [Penicillium robsamsonii]
MKSTKFPKRPTLRWDQYKRQVLCCLYRFFMCDKKETEEIFSYMFRGHLNERGIRGFVPFATLNTQWVWMKNKRDPVWSHVHLNTAFETDGEWKGVVTKIKSAAKTLRFQLREKTEDDTNISPRSSLGSDGDRSSACNGPLAPMLPHTLSTPETLNPMVLLFPSQDRVSNERSRASQSVDQIIYQQNDLHSNISNAFHRTTEPVVSSHGKLCLWCDHEGATYESGDTQELQNEDYDHESGYKDNSHANQHNNRQDDPDMREYTQGFKRFMRELDGEVSSDEELFDSAREKYAMLPQESPPKLGSFYNPHLSMPSDLEQESLGSVANSDWCVDRGSPANLAEFGIPSIPMEDRSGALDDNQIPPKDTQSNFRFSQTRTGHERALGYEWPSDDERRVDNLRRMSVEVLSQIESQSTTQFSSQENMDILMYDGNNWTWM